MGRRLRRLTGRVRLRRAYGARRLRRAYGALAFGSLRETASGNLFQLIPSLTGT